MNGWESILARLYKTGKINKATLVAACNKYEVSQSTVVELSKK